MNPAGDRTRDFIAATIFCWRVARVRSFSRGLQSFLRVRASASACLPSMWRRAGLQAQRVAAVPEAAVDPRDDAAAGVRDAAHRVDELRELREVHDDDVVDVDPEVALDGPDRERRAAEGVGGVDLVEPVARDVDDRVARDRQLRAVPAADAQQLDRVRAARPRRGRARAPWCPSRADRSRGSGSSSALTIGRPAEDELGLRLSVDAVLQELRAEQEQHPRQRDPSGDRERDPLQHPADGSAACAPAAGSGAGAVPGARPRRLRRSSSDAGPRASRRGRAR